MPKVSNDTDFLRSYTCHGLELRTTTSKQAIGECPFCGGEDKFYINTSTGLYDCKVCSPDGGNLYTFMRSLWELLSQVDHSYEKLARQRGLLNPESLSDWGILSSLTGTWLAPGYNSGGEIVQLYRYMKDPKKGKYRFWLTPNSNHGIHCYLSGDMNADMVLVTEGIFDGVLLSEILGKEAMILAVPGCNVFFSNWCSYFAGKDVVLLYDNDHPSKVKVGEGYHEKAPAAITGIKNVVDTLINHSHTPNSISYLRWGNDGDGYSSKLADGYDIGDYLRQGNTLKERKKLWSTLSQKIVPVPDEWKVKKTIHAVNLKPSKCLSWRDLVNDWRKAMQWPESGEGLDYAFSVMLACSLSTSTQGDAVWVKIIGPPSSGKSVLAEACTVAKKYVKALSTLRGLYSGYRTTKDDEEDNSLIPLIVNKTLIIKDGDTLVKSPNAEKILSELRDLYDGAGRSHYNNRMGKDYEGVRFTLIICGTEALSILDRSELGERFIDCAFLETMEESLEDDIGWRVALRACSEVAITSNGIPESLMTEEMLNAKQKTAGYIEYLRNNADRLISKVYFSEETLRYCQKLAEFTSFMRTKQPLDRGKGHPEIKAQRELSFRLISQFVRLARCLGAVLNRKEVDEYVMKRVRQVGMDTSRGLSLEVCRELYQVGENGMEQRAIAIVLSQEEAKIRAFLRFLRRIGIIEIVENKSRHHMIKQKRWRLTSRIRRLYELVVLKPVTNEQE